MERNTTNRLLALLINGLPGWFMLLAGLALAGVSVFADSLGIGGMPGIIGWKQIAGAVVGGSVAFAGGWIGIRSGSFKSDGNLSENAHAIADTTVQRPVYDTTALRIPFLHEISELYLYRYLLLNLVSRDLKVRYKRSALGFVWAMVNPLLTMAVMVAVFLNLFKVKVENYPVYLLSGILLWRLFSSGTSVAMRSLLNTSSIRKKIYVPASVFVAASIGSALVNLFFALIPLLLLAILTGVKPQLTWLLVPVPIIQTAIFAFGVGLLVSAMAVFFADVLDIYEVLVNAYYYLTPIVYPISILPAFLAKLEQGNPMFHFIDGLRALLIDGTVPDLVTLGASTMAALVVLVLAWSIFTRLSDQFMYRA